MNSLQNSPEKKQNEKKIEQYILTKAHLQKKTDYIMSQILEIVNQSDPIKRSFKQYNNKCHEIKKLQEEMINLQNQNKKLQEQNKKLKQEAYGNNLKSSSKISNQNSPGKQSQESQRIPQQIDAQSQGSSQSSKKLQNQLKKLGYQAQAKLYNLTNDQHNFASSQIKQEHENFSELDKFLMLLFESLLIRFSYSEAQSLKQNQQQSQQITNNDDKVLVNRQKYKNLLSFYVNVLIQKALQKIKKQKITSNQTQKLRSFQGINENEKNKNKQVPFVKNQHANLPQVQTVQQLEALFESLANQAGFSKEWVLFMQKNKEQAISFKWNIQRIAKGDKQKDQISKLSNQSKKNISKGQISKLQNEKTLLSWTQKSSQKESQTRITEIENKQTEQRVIDSLNRQIQDQLFDKIQKIVKILSFTEKQIRLYNAWNSKRKIQRKHGYYLPFLEQNDKRLKEQSLNAGDSIKLNSLFQQLQSQKFNNQNLSKRLAQRQSLGLIGQLSKQYSFVLLKALNLSMMSIMTWILDHQEKQQNQSIVYGADSKIRKSFINNSQNIFGALHLIIQKNSNQYIKNLNNKKQKSEQILPKVQKSNFDQDNLLQKCIGSIIQANMNIFRNNIFIYNKKINLQIK